MSNHTALNSSTPSSNQTRDEDDLKALKLQDSDLDNFAAFFDMAFQGNSQNITVLVGLLQRLREVEKLRQQKESGIWIEDIVSRLTHRLYIRCEQGWEAASRFGTDASDSADHIFSEVLPGQERVVRFVAGGRSK